MLALLAVMAAWHFWPRLAAWYADGTLLLAGLAFLAGLLLAMGGYALLVRPRPAASRPDRPPAPAVPPPAGPDARRVPEARHLDAADVRGLTRKVPGTSPLPVPDGPEKAEPRQVPQGEPVPGVLGRASTPGEERLARLAYRTLLGALPLGESPRIFVNWLGKVDGTSTQVDCVAVLDRAIAVFEHKDLHPRICFMNGGDADWVSTYPDGKSYPTENPLMQNDAHLYYLRRAHPDLEYLSLAVVANDTPVDRELPIIVHRGDDTQRAVVHERQVAALLRNLAAQPATPEQAASTAALWEWLRATDESGDPEAVAAHERWVRAAKARRRAAGGTGNGTQ